MTAAVVIHSGATYPYPQAVLSQVAAPARYLPAAADAPDGRPCRHATYMRGADGQVAVFSLEGPLRERVPVNQFPPVRLRLRGARPAHVTTAATWQSRLDDQLSAYFSEAAARYRGAEPMEPWRRPFTVGASTGNRKNLSTVGSLFSESDPTTAADSPPPSLTSTNSRGRLLKLPDAAASAAANPSIADWTEHREEVRRHQERMRQSAQVSALLAPAENPALAGDVRSRFWSESSRASAGSGGGGCLRRCSTAPAGAGTAGEAASAGDVRAGTSSYRRVSGNRVLSRMRDQLADMPVIF